MPRRQAIKTFRVSNDTESQANSLRSSIRGTATTSTHHQQQSPETTTPDSSTASVLTDLSLVTMDHDSSATSQTESPIQSQSLINHLLDTAKRQTPSVVITSIHERANKQYRLVKSRKQDELRYKIFEAQKRGDKSIVKGQKKKNDNHASAVASRIKQDFTIKEFESLVKQKMIHNHHLANAFIQQSSIISRREAEINGLLQFNDMLKKQLDECQKKQREQQAIEGQQQQQQQLQQQQQQQQRNLHHQQPPQPQQLCLDDDFSTPTINSFENNENENMTDNVGLLSTSNYNNLFDDYIVENANTNDNIYVSNEFCSPPKPFEPTPWETIPSDVISNRQLNVRAQLKATDDEIEGPNPLAA